MGYWHGMDKERIIKAFWDQEYYDSANDLAKKYYTQEMNSLANFINADSKEEYEKACGEYLTALTRKNYAESGVLSEAELNSITVSPETALKVITGGYNENAKCANFNCHLNPQNYRKDIEEHYLRDLPKFRSPQEKAAVGKISALHKERRIAKEFNEASAKWATEDIDTLVAYIGRYKQADDFIHVKDFSRMSNKVKSMHEHAAKALKSGDNAAFFSEAAEIFVDYINLDNLGKRPDQPDNILHSDNEKLKEEIQSKLEATYSGDRLNDFKLDLWHRLGESFVSEVFREIDVHPQLPEALRDDPTKLDATELDWYQQDREKAGRIENRFLDGDDVRQSKADAVGMAIYDIRTSPDKETAYKAVADYVLLKREFERSLVGHTREEMLDEERLKFHNEEDYPRIYNKIKEDFQDKTLRELKDAFYSGSAAENYAKELHEELELPFKLFTDAFIKNGYGLDDVEPWESIKQKDEEMRALAAQEPEADEDAPEIEDKPEVEETEEERAARERQEKIQSRVDELDKQRENSSKGLSDKKLAELNEKFDNLKKAVSSDNPQEILEHTAKALVAEFKAHLGKDDVLLNNGLDNAEADVKLLSDILRKTYTDEQLLSDKFKETITEADRFGRFRGETEQLKNEIVAGQPDKLKEALKAAGVNPDSKYSLQRLSIISNNVKSLSKDSKVNDYLDNIRKINSLRARPAYGITASGKQFREIYLNATVTEGIETYCQGVSGFNKMTNQGVFKAMAENRLVVASADGNPENTRFINMGAKGPIVSKTVQELKADIEAKNDTFKENGFTSLSAMKKAVAAFDKVVAMEAKAEGIIDKCREAILADPKYHGSMDLLQNAVINYTAPKTISEMDASGNVTADKVDDIFPKTSNQLAKEIMNAHLKASEPEKEAVKEAPVPVKEEPAPVKEEPMKAAEEKKQAPKQEAPEKPTAEGIDAATKAVAEGYSKAGLSDGQQMLAANAVFAQNQLAHALLEGRDMNDPKMQDIIAGAALHTMRFHQFTEGGDKFDMARDKKLFDRKNILSSINNMKEQGMVKAVMEQLKGQNPMDIVKNGQKTVMSAIENALGGVTATKQESKSNKTVENKQKKSGGMGMGGKG